MSIDFCRDCPRDCGVDRNTQTGFCQVPDAVLRVAKACLHPWEEPPISGSRGHAGTVFFSGCSLGCIYCQNREISRSHKGYSLSEAGFLNLAWRFVEAKATCLELVTPDHLTRTLSAYLAKLKAEHYPLPIVWNGSAYQKMEALQRLEGLVDIYMPDLKHIDPKRAERYLHAKDYPHIAWQALKEMHRQLKAVDGRAVVWRSVAGERLLARGILIRHLVLPGGYFEAARLMRQLDESYGEEVLFSLLGQYEPAGLVTESAYPELFQPLNPRAYRYLESLLATMRFEAAFSQALPCSRILGERIEASPYTPRWDGAGVLEDDLPEKLSLPPGEA